MVHKKLEVYNEGYVAQRRLRITQRLWL